MRKRRGKWDTLESVLNEIWSMLKSGAARYNDPFHRPVLGTLGECGCGLRTVILRRVIMPGRVLVCHTDARAAKAREIMDFDRIGWLFYHPKKKIQLRISGRATLHTEDEFADEQWAETGIASRLNYGTIEPPGSPIDEPASGFADFLIHRAPTLLESETFRKNFMAISSSIDAVDWLRLSPLGHRRARFVWDEKGLKATWLVP